MWYTYVSHSYTKIYMCHHVPAPSLIPVMEGSNNHLEISSDQNQLSNLPLPIFKTHILSLAGAVFCVKMEDKWDYWKAEISDPNISTVGVVMYHGTGTTNRNNDYSNIVYLLLLNLFNKTKSREKTEKNVSKTKAKTMQDKLCL